MTDVGRVLRALDTTENDFATTQIFELDANGGFTDYGWLGIPNPSEEPLEIFEFGQEGVSYMTIQGEEVQPEPIPGEKTDEGVQKYRARLPHPIPPKETISLHWTARRPEKTVAGLENGNWRFGPGKLLLTEPLLYVFAVRLPKGASVVEPEPEPQEIRSNGATTVIWRDTLPPNNPKEFWLEYRL